eukprot:scaffold16712_cov65-Phaeocystis_antarctica.AAC.4
MAASAMKSMIRCHRSPRQGSSAGSEDGMGELQGRWWGLRVSGGCGSPGRVDPRKKRGGGMGDLVGRAWDSGVQGVGRVRLAG